MDFTQAALLVAGLFAMIELVKRVAPALTGWALQLAVFLVAILGTVLIAHTDYAHAISVGGKSLDDVNTLSQVFIGILIAGGSTLTHQVVSAIPSIGENQPNPPAAAQ